MSNQQQQAICIPLFNGICNRLLPMMSALRLSLLSKKRLVVLWTPRVGRSCLPWHGEDVQFKDLFEPIQNITMSNDQSVFNPYLKQGFERYNFHKDQLREALIDVYQDKTLLIEWLLFPVFSRKDNVDYSKYLLNTTGKYSKDVSFHNLQMMFQMYLQPVSSIQEEINHISGKFSEKMIGLHLRRGDGEFTERDWKDADEFLLKEVGKWVLKGYGVFLATDDGRVSERFREVRGVVEYRPQIDKYNNNKHNVQCGIVDLYLLSKCDVIVGTAGSTFSFTSLLLSKPDTDLYYISSDDYDTDIVI